MAKSKAAEKKNNKAAVGEVENLSPEQLKIIDETVLLINDRWNSHCRNLIEIGQHLLTNFYNDDPDLAKSRGRKKEGISLRKLAIRPDLNVSIATLSRAFNLAVQEKELAKINDPQLTESHKILLLHIGDAKEKATYAKKIITDKLSCREFTKLLIKDDVIHQRGIRSGQKKQLPADTVDSLDLFIEPLETIINFDLDNFDFSQISKDKSQDFVDSVKKAKEMIDRLYSTVTGANP